MADASPAPGLTGVRRFLLEWSDIPLRAALAATFIVHGYDKIFVTGVDKMVPAIEGMGMPVPAVMAWLAALAEFGGGIAVGIGFMTRLAALSHVVVMAVAIFGVHYEQGFKMGTEITLKGARMTGYEWQFALLCIALCLFMRGAGPISVDAIMRAMKSTTPEPEEKEL